MATPLSTPSLVAQTSDIDGHDNFPSACSFSPDGLCVLTNTSADSKLRLYNTLLPKNDDTEPTGEPMEWKAALSCVGGNAVRSYMWYPLMKSSNAGSCCFVVAARNQPIHLYDAYTGAIRASYRPFNALDEMESASVVTFDPTGAKICAGGFRTDRTLHVFATSEPGRSSTLLRIGKTRRSSDGQKGLISSLAYSPDGNLLAVGTFSPGSIYVYDERSGSQPSGTILTGLCVVGHGRSHSRKKRRFVAVDKDETTEESRMDWLSSAKIKWFLARAQSGVTQLRFAPNTDYVLYSASRRSSAILAWDLRMLGGKEEYQSNPIAGFGSFETDNDTNQRIEFDLDTEGSTLYTGGRDGCVRIYDVQSGELQGTIDGLEDAANGVSYGQLPSTSNAFLAVASGSRRFPSEEELENDPVSIHSDGPPGYLRLYKL